MAADFGAKKAVKIALFSRLFSFLFQSFSNNLIVDYDTSEEHYPCQANTTIGQTSKQISMFDQIVSLSLGGNSKWDAVYFLDIAQHGYQYEQNMAFFPILPLCVFSFGKILKPLELLLNLSGKSTLLLSALFINTAAFTVAAIGLFHLTRTTFHSPKLAQHVVILFCFNPASVFFSATYSESIFSMTQFWGMFLLERQPTSYFAAALVFSLGTGVRSNGIVSCGYIGYKILQEMFLLNHKSKKTDNQCKAMMSGLKVIKMLFLCCIVVLPFLLFQFYGYILFCQNPQASPWCEKYLPLPYSYIQNHYWNVGFFKYYEFKQLPNFVLASPVLVMSVLGIWDYLKDQNKMDMLYIGLAITKKSNALNIFVYVIHLAFLVVFGMTSMHIQVVTRFIASSSPMVYWIAVSWITPLKHEDSKIYSNFKANFVYTYFLLYYCLGYLLHCNFYPWT